MLNVIAQNVIARSASFLLDTDHTDLAHTAAIHSLVSKRAEGPRMFQYIVEPTPPISRKKAYVLPLSIITHLAILAAAIAIPLFAPGVLPVPATTLMAFISHDIVTPPPPPVAPRVTAETQPQPAVENLNPDVAPIVSPETIGSEPVRETTKGLIRGVEASDGPVLGAEIGSLVNVAPPPAPVEPTPTIRAGGNVTPPKKVHDVAPVYP